MLKSIKAILHGLNIFARDRGIYNSEKYMENEEKLYPEVYNKEDKKESHDNEYLQKYYEALKNKDPKGMEDALIENIEHCESKNSYCLNEVFCPECPFGGLVVTSCRQGWE